MSNSIFFVDEYVKVQADSWAKYCWRGDEVGGGWFGRNGSCNTGTAADVPWHFGNGWLGLLMPGGPIKIFIREVKKTKLTWRENEMSQHVKAKYISNLPKFAKVDQAIDIFKVLGDEFVIVENPNYIHPLFEFCPLTPKIHRIRGNIAGIVQDMDGTTTTTEALCLYSLEYMVRKITGRKDNWRNSHPSHPIMEKPGGNF